MTHVLSMLSKQTCFRTKLQISVKEKLNCSMHTGIVDSWSSRVFQMGAQFHFGQKFFEIRKSFVRYEKIFEVK